MLPNATITLDLRPTEVPLATGVRDNCVFYFKGDEYQYSPDVFGYWNSNCEIAASNYNVDFDSFAAWNSLITNVTDLAISLATFLKWNPAVSVNYTQNFWLGQAYCTHREGQGVSITPSQSASTTTTAKPTPLAPTHTS
ncbi:LysM domain-containing protein [Colletotrichum fructicola]|nr:LysM domain-containing protein [Colletotrichum fructicola]